MRGLAGEQSAQNVPLFSGSALGVHPSQLSPAGPGLQDISVLRIPPAVCLQPSPRSFSPGIGRCETFFYASMRLANLSPTANGQSRTLSIGFWEFSRRAIRFSRQPPIGERDAALGFHAPAV